MKILFLSFQENSDIIGVKYLHAYIRSQGYDSSILLIPVVNELNIKAGIQYILDYQPAVLCISAMTYEFYKAASFLKTLRKEFKDCLFVFGGIHATSDTPDCLSVSDIVVRGEGEETLTALLDVYQNKSRAELYNIPGIAYASQGEIVYNPVNKLITDLDILPYPGHLPERMFVLHKGQVQPLQKAEIVKKYARYQGTFLSVTSSRGCPFSCSYCCNNILKSLYGKKNLRYRKWECVLDEIDQETRKFDTILYVNFQDDCFLMHHPQWIEDFSRSYKEKISIPFIIRTTPRHITREKLTLLKEAGLRWVFMGMQTGSDDINKKIYRRNVTAREYLEAATIVHDLHLSAWYDVILDNPYETLSDHLKTIDILMKTPKPFQLDLFSLDYFPGTELRSKAIADKIPIPEVGEKSYTEPEPKMINKYIRMSATLPVFLMRLLIKIKDSTWGKIIGYLMYYVSLFIEPFVYLYLIFKSNDYNIPRTLKVLRAFSVTAFKKLFFRYQG
ncbi:B12-binding domain-containing radical SAM protein [candidate division CSSED10-310 bacterium]|uniref:B12-binding domain-containing radical SAM protein n=1 Tax=candidate division CSSED10-310 bacterium TaxID=2855610 RepID=A0ABV6YZ00_UNCC1